MKKTFFVALCGLLVALTPSCTINIGTGANTESETKSETPAEAPADSVKAAVVEETPKAPEKPAEPEVPAEPVKEKTLMAKGTSASFAGSVAGQRIHANLNVDNLGNVNGFYYYDKYGSRNTLGISGTLDRNKMYIYEYNDYGDITATWDMYVSRGALTGNFIRTKDGKRFKINLVEI